MVRDHRRSRVELPQLSYSRCGRAARVEAAAVSISSQRRKRASLPLGYGLYITIAMKVYEGGRSLDGSMVTVDGKPLPPRHDIARLSKTGFEWGFEGPAPAQLALALLADHLGDGAAAMRLHLPFMREVVAELDNAWRLTSSDIEAALRRG